MWLKRYRKALEDNKKIAEDNERLKFRNKVCFALVGVIQVILVIRVTRVRLRHED